MQYFIRAGWGAPAINRLSKDKHGWVQWSCEPQSATRFSAEEARDALAKYTDARDHATIEAVTS